MKHLYSRTILLFLFIWASLPAKAQLKLGGDSRYLRSDALLELISTNKGLMLPRVSTAAMNAHPLDTSAAGMIVYNLTDNNFYVKKGAAAASWTRLNDLQNLTLPSLGDVALTAPANGQLLRYNAGKWSNWTPNYVADNHTLNFSGDATGSGSISSTIALTLPNIVTAGTNPRTTYNAKGLITGGGPLLASDIVAGSNNYIQNAPASMQTASFDINGTGKMQSLTVSGLATNGGILFAGSTVGAVAQKTGQLIWDNASNELGIGTATPAAKLDVAGNFKLGTNGTALVSIQKTSASLTDNVDFSYNTVRIRPLLLTGVTLTNNDNIIVNPRDNLPSRIVIAWARVTNAATKEISICFANTGDAQRVGAQTFDITIIQN
ncbi:hypothetical protein ACWKWU_05505 [Chitinophaga lutea]